MGTKLILKNADFSEHAISYETILSDFYNPAFSTYATTQSAPSASPFTQVNWNLLAGKTITAIELKIAAPGILTLGVIDDSMTPNPTILRSVQVNLTGEIGSVQKISLPTPITVNDGERLCIQGPEDTGLFYFIDHNSGTGEIPEGYRFWTNAGVLPSDNDFTLYVRIYGF